MSRVRILVCFSLLVTAVGCGDDGGAQPDAATCPDGFTCYAGAIDADTSWAASDNILLQDKIFVTGGTLTIAAGTTVKAEDGAALVITRDARIEAVGTATEPIVFTSAKDEGMRATGDWAGLALLGSASINRADDDCSGDCFVEGIDENDERGRYGGSDDAHDCGTLQYVRIEFAGDELTVGSELNGLTVGACGSDTTIDYLQVHRGKDDGIEFFGGAANLKHVVITAANDDSLDWDEGWTGKVQHLIVSQMDGGGDNGFESDNYGDMPDGEPRSAPTIYNLTMVGYSESRAMKLREGTWGVIRNAIVTEFGLPVADVEGLESAAGALMDPPLLTIENSLFFNIGADGMSYFPVEMGKDDDDGGFDEVAFFTDAARSNLLGEDPMLGDATSVTAPDFVPDAASPVGGVGAVPPDDGFFDAVDYIGAIPPGGPDWTEGWTAYPAD